MAQVEFQYNGIITTIQCQEDQKISEIFNNFTNKSNINENQINYSYNGKIIKFKYNTYLIIFEIH